MQELPYLLFRGILHDVRQVQVPLFDHRTQVGQKPFRGFVNKAIGDADRAIRLQRHKTVMKEECRWSI